MRMIVIRIIHHIIIEKQKIILPDDYESLEPNIDNIINNNLNINNNKNNYHK